MSKFISVPVVPQDAMSATPPTGIPFSNYALKVASGYYVGTDETNVYIGRVGGTLYFLSPYDDRKGYTWSNTTSYLLPFTVKSTRIVDVFITSSIGIPYSAYAVDLEAFETEDELISSFFDEIISPGSGGDDVNPYKIYVSAVSTEESSEIEVDATAYVEGADTILVNVIAKGGNTIDPNNSGGTSGQSFPAGTFDDSSDPVPIPSMPSLSAAQSGLVTLFRPTKTGVANLGAYLWTHFDDFWENLQKLFTNPMDYFIAFNIFPVNPEVGELREVYIGNWGTSITMPPVLSQWYEFDCGKVHINNYWGSALDYYPNTKVQLMLPFIGAVQLNTDEVMGNNIGVKYRIDLLSGSCVAFVTVNDDVYYQFTGECAVSIPLTGADWSRIYSAVVGAIGTAIAGGVGVAAAGAGATGGGLVAAKSYEAAASGGASWAAINASSKGVRGVAEMRQRMLDVTSAAMDNARDAANRSVRRSEGVRNMRLANTINNTVSQVMGAKASIQHSGTISGSAGMLGVRTPYLIIEYPNQSLADKYKHFVGYPSNMYAKLGELSGYTECEQVIPTGIWGTDDELAELIESLKGGVYL